MRTDDTETRLQAALEAASDAFWARFAAEFPEISTGDLTPPTSVRFDEGIERAAREWLALNMPEALPASAT